MKQRKEKQLKRVLRDFLIEFSFYSIGVIAYILLVLRYLGDWLQSIFQNNLVVYAFISLGLILIQAVVLDSVTTFLMSHIRLQRLE